MGIALKLKQNRYFLIYFATLLLTILLFTPSHITTNMLSIFDNNPNIQKLKTLNRFENSSTLFITIQGFSQTNRDRLIAIEKELQTLPFVKTTKLNLSRIEISDYLKQHYYLLSDFHPIPLNQEAVSKRVAALKAHLLDAVIYQPIDKNDPLKLFEFKKSFTDNGSLKEGFLALGNYGYLLTATLNGKTNDLETSTKIEQELTSLFSDQEDIILFSSLFFTAQNSQAIQSSVHTILYLSFILLGIVFVITLRDYKVLLVNTLTLASSIFVALAISTVIFHELSIFTLAFGSAISSIAVDYLFHNYFHEQYRQKGFNRSIFLAFLTTVLGFIFLQFVRFPLIAQLSVFAVISLAFSYFQFTFIYPTFGFTPKANRIRLTIFNYGKRFLPVYAVFALSLLTLLYAVLHITFDYNLQNLDYDNKVLKSRQALIQTHMPPKATLLLEAESVDALIEKAHAIEKQIHSTHALSKLALSQAQFNAKIDALSHYDFQTLKALLATSAKELGFKENYFNSAYRFIETLPQTYRLDLDALRESGLEVLQEGNHFYTIVTMDKADLNKLVPQEGVYVIDGVQFIKETTQKMFDNLLIYLFLSFLTVLSVIIVTLKKKTLLAVNFILFPVAMILLYLTVVPMNIMHLFSIIIIIIAGIDYGIYMSQEDSPTTKEAILYSLLTTFSGFGILLLSSIGAIQAIGSVITIGILSILFLIMFMKNVENRR